MQVIEGAGRRPAQVGARDSVGTAMRGRGMATTRLTISNAGTAASAHNRPTPIDHAGRPSLSFVAASTSKPSTGASHRISTGEWRFEVNAMNATGAQANNHCQGARSAIRWPRAWASSPATTTMASGTTTRRADQTCGPANDRGSSFLDVLSVGLIAELGAQVRPQSPAERVEQAACQGQASSVRATRPGFTPEWRPGPGRGG